MAIDSAWGTGKTSLIELLCEDITKNENNIEVINYNAWKNDYCSNAFEPLFYEIVNSDVFINSLTKLALSEILENNSDNSLIIISYKCKIFSQ